MQLRADRGTVWLTQLEMAELFNASKQNISPHLKNVYQDGDLDPAATVKDSLTVQTEGAREVRRSVTLYNLDAILAVGYRVRSPRGVQFRRKVKKMIIKNFTNHGKSLMSLKEPYVTPIENIQNLWKAVLCEYVERVNELTGYYERATSPLLRSKYRHELILERMWLESSNEKPGSFIWICYALDIDLNKTRNNLEKLFEVLN